MQINRTILAAAFFLFLSMAASAQSTTPVVMLDYYFNREWQHSSGGDSVRFHYTWEDTANSGFSQLGEVFRDHGFRLAALEDAPSAAMLRKASVYLIVDPDNEKETAHPHYVRPADVRVIRDWVSAGGILILMANDKGNAELTHFNQLSEAFGIHFNEDCVNHVIGDERTPGTIHTPAGDPVFGSPLQLYMKDVSSLRLTGPAKPAIVNNGHTIAATAKVGRGIVFALGDPWIYNEYIDHRILPAAYQNLEGAKAWVSWLRSQTH